MPKIIIPKYNTATHKFIRSNDPDATPRNIAPDEITAFKKLPKLGPNYLNRSIEKITIPKTVGSITILETFVGIDGEYSKISYNGEEYYIQTYKGDYRNVRVLESLNKTEISPRFDATDRFVFESTPISIINSWWEREYDIANVDPSSQNLYIVVSSDYQDTGGSDEELERRAQEALIVGTQKLLKSVGKRYGRDYIISLFDKYFEFSKIVEYTIPTRPCSYLLFLVALKKSYALSPDLEPIRIEDLIEDGEDLGAGDVANTKKFISIEFKNFEEFSKIIAKYFEFINHFAKVQNDFLDDFRATMKNFINVVNLKELAQLDLEQESSKFIDSKIYGSNYSKISVAVTPKDYNFLTVLRNLFFINGIDVDTLSGDQSDRITFGFDDNFNINYIGLVRNGAIVPIKKFTQDIFVTGFGEGGFASPRDGYLLYSIATLYTPTSTGENIELERAKSLKLNEFIIRHVIPTPPLLEIPTGDDNCIKDSAAKILSSARNLAQVSDLGYYTYLSYRSGSLANQLDPSYTRGGNLANAAVGGWAEATNITSQAFSQAFGDASSSIINDLKNFSNREHFQKLIQNIIVCLLRGVDGATLQNLLKDFASLSEYVLDLLREIFCNPKLVAALDVLSKIPAFPKIKNVDIHAALVAELRKALAKIILELYMAIINELIALSALCSSSDPNSPYNAADDLGLDAAINNFLNNLNPANSAEVNDLYDNLGFDPSSDENPNRASEDDKNKIKELIYDVSCILNTIEVCNLMVGGSVSDEVYGLIKNILRKKYPDLLNIFKTREQLVEFFGIVGNVLNIRAACEAKERAAEENNLEPSVCLCLKPDIEKAARDNLANRDISPEQIDNILNDLRDKKRKRIEDLLDKLNNIPDETPPALCKIDENGNIVKGLINAGKADPTYTAMFADSLKFSVDAVMNVFKDEIKDLPTAFEERDLFGATGGMSEVSRIMNTNFPPDTENNLTSEQVKKRELVKAGILKRTAKDRKDFKEKKEANITSGLSDAEAEKKALDDIEEDDESEIDYSFTAPNTGSNLIPAPKICPIVRDNLNNTRTDYYDSIKFKVDSSKERDRFVSSTLGSLQLAQQTEIEKIVRDASTKILQFGVNQIGEAIVQAVTEYYANPSEQTKDVSEFLFGFTDENNTAEVVAGLVALANQVVLSLAAIYDPNNTTGASTTLPRSFELPQPRSLALQQANTGLPSVIEASTTSYFTTGVKINSDNPNRTDNSGYQLYKDKNTNQVKIKDLGSGKIYIPNSEEALTKNLAQILETDAIKDKSFLDETLDRDIAKLAQTTQDTQNQLATTTRDMDAILAGAGPCVSTVDAAIQQLDIATAKIKNSQILGRILRIVNNALLIAKDAATRIATIEGQVSKAYELVASVSSSFPDYNMSYNYGLSHFSGSQGILKVYSQEKPRHYYEMVITKNYKPFVTVQTFEEIDEDIIKFIKDGGYDAGFDTQTGAIRSSLQAWSFQKYMADKFNYNKQQSDSLYLKIQKQFLDDIQTFTSSSAFFDSFDYQFDTLSGAPPGLADKTLQTAYIRFLNLPEQTNTKADIACGKDNNLLDTDKIKDKTKQDFVEDACNFVEQEGDGRGRRKTLYPTQQALSNAAVAITIRLYLYDYFMRGIFPFATVRPGAVYTNLMADYFMSFMESEMKGIDKNYYTTFLDEAAQYFDKENPSAVQAVNQEFRNVTRVKKFKLRQLILNEIPYISRRLGTKINRALSIAASNIIDIPSDIPIIGGTKIIKKNDFTYKLEPIYANQAEIDAWETRKEELEDELIVILNTFGTSITITDEQQAILEEYRALIANPPAKNVGFDPLRKPVNAFEMFSGPQSISDQFTFIINNQFKVDDLVILDKFTDDTSNKTKKDTTIDFKFLFEFCFPIRQYVTLYTMQCHLANSAKAGIGNIFSGTKAELAGMQTAATSRNGYDATLATSDSASPIGNPNLFNTAHWKYMLKSLIKTPLSVLKGLAETGDTNVFLASLPYNVTRMFTLTFSNKLPWDSWPQWALTPAIGLGLIPFWIIPSSFGIMYYALGLWIDWDWFDRNGPGNSPFAGSAADDFFRDKQIDPCEVAESDYSPSKIIKELSIQDQKELNKLIDVLDIKEEYL